MRAELLHVFTARFNPIRWETPQRLYERWTQHMLDSGVKLTVIECQYGERPFVCECPHVHHIGVRADSWAWTKENLINIGIARVPSAKYICWSDSDVWHRRPSWAVETVEALQHYRFIQPWSDAYDLGPNDEHLNHFKSFCYQVAHGKSPVPDRNGWKHPYAEKYPHPGYCITEGTDVVPGGRVYAATSRFWQGDIVVLRTAAGHELAVTPNHPILTDRGWEPASAINVGDDVFSTRPGHSLTIEGDKQHVPAAIDEIARSFAQAPGVGRSATPTRSEDFHGDGGGSEVTVIWTDRLLRDAIEADFNEELREEALGFGLMQAEPLLRQRTSTLLVEALDLAASRGEIAYCGDLLAAGAGNIGDHPSAHGGCDLGSLLRGISSPSSLVGIGLGSEGAALLEPIERRGRVHADDPRRLLGTLAGQVERDQVVYVGIRKFSGHVYNLSTERGFIVASNILTHNCWASTRRVLEYPGGLFELGGMGSSDHAMALALIGKAVHSAPRGSNPAYVEALKTWQERLLPAVNGRIGFVHGTIEHHWHGAKKSRGYLSRWQMFLRHGFDPITDLKRNTWGVLEFAGNKPELEREWDLYLRSRNEDSNYADN